MSEPFTPEQEARVGEMIADALAQKAAEGSARFVSIMNALAEISSSAGPVGSLLMKAGVGDGLKFGREGADERIRDIAREEIESAVCRFGNQVVAVTRALSPNSGRKLG
ncbi:hypothetical protein PX554_13665 [Sphingomonas sp. H39-1-10]|uniref:hypothetical protein n=1 Tax=Sphingomonas pollutisoli TaxID=3030829 RepID=UPI0023B92035|nr:hypothetical protein [Sphingomonas pollutisoli]MDF0489183.1 hypothetical protein [Sphingomonas pollutisoli]